MHIWYMYKMNDTVVPRQPKIYHIVHLDRLISIITDKCLLSDAELANRDPNGTKIGMDHIKKRRLALKLKSHPDLFVGSCVPFYFCPRSIMLYLIHKANHPDLKYCDGQKPIVHLEADLYASVRWADQQKKRWAFTLANAGSNYFEDRNSLLQLNEINWHAIKSRNWGGDGVHNSIKEDKQAEFLIEKSFPWQLVERIGVHSKPIQSSVLEKIADIGHKPKVEIIPMWYY